MPAVPRAGPDWRGAFVAGHFGEFLQGRLGPDGPVCLVTLPCPALGALAFYRSGGPFAMTAGFSSPLAPARAARLLRLLSGTPPRGRLLLRWSAPPGGGAGASTAALVAAARAAAPEGRALAPARLAELCRRLEGAVDPVMEPSPAGLLWASREARVLRGLPPPPRFRVVGGFHGRGERTDARDARFPDVSDLVADWAEAAGRGEFARLGALATASALRNAALRGGPDPAPLLALAERVGALGVVAAHTGSARGLLFRPGVGDAARAAAALRALGLRSVLAFDPPAARGGGG